MLGESALNLVKEAARNQSNLNAFNEDLVRQTIEETRRLWEQNRSEVAETSAIGPATTLRHAAIERNKRCMLAYLGHRAQLLQDMRWQMGAVLPPEVRACCLNITFQYNVLHTMYRSQVKLNTCEPELEMFTRYSKLLAGYMRGVGTDLTTDVSPPKCLYIEVRAVTSSILS